MEPSAVLDPLELVERALYALNFSALRAQEHLRDWFVRAFNEWYAPLVPKQPPSFAAVFDYGLQLVRAGPVAGQLPDSSLLPTARFSQYQRFLRELPRKPLMARARAIHDAASRSARAEVGRLLIQALLCELSPGCAEEELRFRVHEHRAAWDAAQEAHLQDCPRCAQMQLDRQAGRSDWWQARDGVPGGYAPPEIALGKGGEIVVRSEDERGQWQVCGTLPLQIPAFDPTRPWPAFWLPPAPDDTEVPNRFRLFMAHVACHKPGAELDDPVVEACLGSRDKPATEHEPPRRHNTVLEERTKSRLPGAIAGTTRIETKTDLDSWLDVVPSELALYVYHRPAGLQHLLGKPLIYKREREQDQVPKHRALVCFVVESGHEAEEGGGAAHSQDASLPYVFAKRQAFDLIRDLREAAELLRNRADVEIDVAVFVLRAYREEAIVHRLFRLERLLPRQSGHEGLDRFDQMIRFGSLVPGYFNRPGIREPPAELGGEPGTQEIIDPRLEQFLQRHPQRVASYHGVYLVALGSVERLMQFLPAAVRDLPLSANVRRRVLLIAVDPARHPDPVQRQEPAWSSVLAGSMHEAAARLGGPLEDKPLFALRTQFVEMVLGTSEGRSRQQRALEFV